MRELDRFPGRLLRISEEAQRKLIRIRRPGHMHGAEGGGGVDLEGPTILHPLDGDRGAVIDQGHQPGHIDRAVEYLDIAGRQIDLGLPCIRVAKHVVVVGQDGRHDQIGRVFVPT
ncbi:hypothetical protein D3C84_1093650 [compost metagenome]